jgi:hypothetical protein
MSTGPGNDPFSGSNTQNILLHIVSPKIVNDGSGGYTVKTDLINIDNAYINDVVTSKIGSNAGTTNQGASAIAIGDSAGTTNQGLRSVAIGYTSGNTNQGNFSVAVGGISGSTGQGVNTVAVGYGAGNSNQGANATAVGFSAGQINQGQYGVAIGYGAASTNQHANSIMINASSSAQNTTSASSCFIIPIRNLNGTGTGFNRLYYNPTTGEVAYDSTQSYP